MFLGDLCAMRVGPVVVRNASPTSFYLLLFGRATAIAPWMAITVQVLGLLWWLVGTLVVYTFPD